MSNENYHLFTKINSNKLFYNPEKVTDNRENNEMKREREKKKVSSSVLFLYCKLYSDGRGIQVDIDCKKTVKTK